MSTAIVKDGKAGILVDGRTCEQKRGLIKGIFCIIIWIFLLLLATSCLKTYPAG